MAFQDDVLHECWMIVDGLCESCYGPLVWENRGREDTGAWEAHHMDGDSTDNSLSNCRILCWDCHEENS